MFLRLERLVKHLEFSDVKTHMTWAGRRLAANKISCFVFKWNSQNVLQTFFFTHCYHMAICPKLKWRPDHYIPNEIVRHSIPKPSLQGRISTHYWTSVRICTYLLKKNLWGWSVMLHEKASVFQFNPKLFNGLEWAPCRSLDFLHTKPIQPLSFINKVYC